MSEQDDTQSGSEDARAKKSQSGPESARTKKFSSRTQAVAALIASAAALITSFGSMMKSSDKSVEKASYEELSKRVSELQVENASLRMYQGDLHKKLESDMRHAGVQDAVRSDALPPAPAPPATGSLPAAAPHASVKPHSGGAAAPAAASVRPPPSMPPFPSGRPMSPPPPWASIQGK